MTSKHAFFPILFFFLCDLLRKRVFLQVVMWRGKPIYLEIASVPHPEEGDGDIAAAPIFDLK